MTAVCTENLKSAQVFARHRGAIEGKGGLLFAHSAVTDIDELEDGVRVTTDGGNITATRAVFATNSPINDRVALHSKMAPYRTYAMAFTIPRGTLPAPTR